MKIRFVTEKEIEYIASCLSSQWPDYNETDRDFSTCSPEGLESCVLSVQSHRVKGLPARAAVLFYQLLKKRPFRNGNKRIALAAMLHFLYKNSRWIAVDPDQLRELTLWAAQSPEDVRGDTLRGIERFLDRHSTSFHEPAPAAEEPAAAAEKPAEAVEQLDLVLA